MKKIFLGISLLLAFVAAEGDASAQCCCFLNVSADVRGSRYATAYEELKNSHVVFLGQVIEMKMIDRTPVREGGRNYELEIKFRVEKAWRRDLNEVVTLRDDDESCSVGFDIADRWLVYAHLDDNNNLRTGYCTRTRVIYKNIERDLKEFEQKGEKQTKIIKSSPQ